MTYATPEKRREMIAGLRELADYLAIHPDVPTPRIADVFVFPPDDTDAAMRAEIDAIADHFGWSAEYDNGHYRVTKNFGPVTYRAIAIVGYPEPSPSTTTEKSEEGDAPIKPISFRPRGRCLCGADVRPGHQVCSKCRSRARYRRRQRGAPSSGLFDPPEEEGDL